MNKRKKEGLRLMVLSGLVIASSIVWFSMQESPAVELADDTTNASSTIATSSDNAGNNVSIESEGGDYSVEIIPVTIEKPTFSLERDITFPDIIPMEVRPKFVEATDAIIARLEADNTLVDEWVALGKQWKFVDDYEGAALAWGYAAYLNSNYHVPFLNLASLYKNFAPNYALSEEYYLKVIAVEPELTSGYRGIHELYRYNLKDNNRAVAIVEEGIERNPQDLDLKLLLARFYKEEGDVSNAKKWYEEAKNTAERAGSVQMVKDIAEELNSL